MAGLFEYLTVYVLTAKPGPKFKTVRQRGRSGYFRFSFLPMVVADLEFVMAVTEELPLLVEAAAARIRLLAASALTNAPMRLLWPPVFVVTGCFQT